MPSSDTPPTNPPAAAAAAGAANTPSSASLSGKVIVLTGAASGIGLATAKLLASHGATLSLADNNAALLSTAVKDILAANPGASCFGTVLDVRSRQQVDAWIAETVDKYGGIDGCGNIAGVIGKCQGSQRTWEITDEEYDFIMDVNVRGLMNCLRAQIPHVKAGGSIVNASSICGLVGLPLCSVYCASKHAVVGMTRAAAKELGPKGVRVNCFNPGFIATPMLSASIDSMDKGVTPSSVAMQRLGKPEEVANLIEWLLSDGSSYVTGATMGVDGGWNC
ncbi:hypothetical protein NLU13_0956 [Sarocladium strictum]|uniref:Uncharacterized protein n=1 Tax=Sarocladium strictum TaxID=5046 RepID=A0AA39GQ15_SARSR|nr:hypothetical protein NLU13_0956 [Sarocladium strictum]